MTAPDERNSGEVGLAADLPFALAVVEGASYRLQQAQAVWQADVPEAVAGVLAAAEAAAASQWVVGWVAYEAAAAFGLPCHAPPDQLPLAWFAAFAQAEPWIFPPVTPPQTMPWRLGLNQAAHRAAVERIQSYILAGDTYQVNLTLQAELSVSLDPLALFLHLQPRHRFPYALYLDTGAWRIASFSPELFLARRGDWLVTGPIKGTRPRSPDPVTDARLAHELETSAKERAEHVMIVDMARNDLGRICQVGTVGIEGGGLLERRAFSTVHHLETRVRGRLRPGLGLAEAMAALFPAASITGAPKHRTMAIIRELEPHPRGIYTGALGVVRPGGEWQFNVAIRTVTQGPDGRTRLGLGGGIVADSEADQEWAEIAHKGAFLRQAPPSPGLIETALVDAQGQIPRLTDHLARLAHSARVLGLPCDLDRAGALLAGATPGMVARLHLAADGLLSLQQRPAPAPRTALRVLLWQEKLDHRDLLYQHKSDRRALFERALAAAAKQGCDDALMLNDRGRVVSGAMRALLMQRAGVWLAPPLEEGLLPSLWRAERMREVAAGECPLTLAELMGAERVEMGNAVRGGAQLAALVDGQGATLVAWQNGMA